MDLSIVVLAALVLVAGLLYKLRAPKVEGVPMSASSEWFLGMTRVVLKDVVQSKKSAAHFMTGEIVKAGWKAVGVSLIGGKSGLLIVEPDDIKCMLKDDFHSFEKGPVFIENFKDVLGGGIFNSNGTVWKEQRTVASHMFNRRQLRDRMSRVFGANSQAMVQIVDAHAKSSSAPFDVQALFYHYAFDSINGIAFNRQVNSLGGNTTDCEFQDAFDALQEGLSERFMVPWWKVDRWLNLSASARSFAKNLKIVNNYVYGVVADYYDENDNIREDKLEGDQTMTGLFLEHALAEGKKYSREFLRDMILNFLIAGRDTTASALTSCVEFICRHPEWQDKLYEEAMVCFNGNVQEMLDFDDVEGKTPIATAVVMESVRLHPPVPGNEKVAVEDVTLPSGIPVKAGTYITWLPLATNQYEKYWGSDAADFKPTRWLEPGFDPSDFMYPTFQAGPRLCLGKNMAILEAKIALLTLVARYRFTLANEPKVTMAVTWQLTKEGCLVNLQPRA